MNHPTHPPPPQCTHLDPSARSRPRCSIYHRSQTSDPCHFAPTRWRPKKSWLFYHVYPQCQCHGASASIQPTSPHAAQSESHAHVQPSALGCLLQSQSKPPAHLRFVRFLSHGQCAPSRPNRASASLLRCSPHPNPIRCNPN